MQSRYRLSGPLALLVALAVASLASCKLLRGRSTTLASQPHAADRYARLLIAQMADSDPVPRAQEIMCETGRLMSYLGPDEATRRMEAVEDSVYHSVRAKLQRRRIDGLLGGHSFDGGGPICDSLDVIANREVPLKHTPEGVPGKGSTPPKP